MFAWYNVANNDTIFDRNKTIRKASFELLVKLHAEKNSIVLPNSSFSYPSRSSCPPVVVIVHIVSTMILINRTTHSFNIARFDDNGRLTRGFLVRIFDKIKKNR